MGGDGEGDHYVRSRSGVLKTVWHSLSPETGEWEPLDTATVTPRPSLPLPPRLQTLVCLKHVQNATF